ncbi:MAG: FAD:protein FMN transferase [Chloroflexi bacterium]|nr:FAD:protein FMN transferase [Chloroflexota bacterium]MCL5274337.1 FAD:protein FMN transferase [Chloroflexota bacterium]
MFGFVRSLRFKLTLWFVGVLAIVIFVISALLYFGLERVLLQSVDANLRTAGVRSVAPASTTPTTQEPGYPQSLQSDQLRRLVLLSNTPARLLALDGSVLQSDPLFPQGISITQEALTTAASGAARFETIEVNSNIYRLYTAPVKVNDIRAAVVQVVDSMDDQVNTLAGLRSLLAWLIPLSLIFAGISGSFLAGRALAPMTRVRRDVEKIIEQSDLSHRVSADLPDDEVGQLARTFDQLLERVEQAMERERRFTSDASHELRTPLTVLKGEISVALARVRSAEDYRTTLSQLESTVDDMSQLVEDLLTLTRAAANKQMTILSPLNVTELVLTICDRMQVIAFGKGIALNPPTETAAVIVNADRIKLQRVFTNLIDNALRYTHKGGRVDVVLRLAGKDVCIDVRDTGHGIAAKHLPKLFQRFYRADNDRARDSGGSGLGLAIAQSIAKGHGGKITLESTLGRGSCFTVTLPLAPAQEVFPLPDAESQTPESVPALNEGKTQPNPIPVTVHTVSSVELHDRTFRAMNTDITLFLLSADTRHANGVLDAAEWFFVQTEWRLSRFREGSELSALNRSGSAIASRTLFQILQLAAQAHADSNGVFNPLITPALAAAGYDHTFDEIGTDAVITSQMDASIDAPSDAGVLVKSAVAGALHIPTFTDSVALNPITRLVTLRNGAQLDLGGIAKGWAIDRAFRTLSKLGPCCVNAGGDVHVGGSFEEGGKGWRIDIADPFAANDAEEQSARAVVLKDQAIATSGIMKRRWIVNGNEKHHLIDPRTGQPAQNSLLFVTAIADTAVQAEVAAKTIFILGEEEGSAWATDRRIPALLMFRDGEYLCNEYFPSTE